MFVGTGKSASQTGCTLAVHVPTQSSALAAPLVNANAAPRASACTIFGMLRLRLCRDRCPTAVEDFSIACPPVVRKERLVLSPPLDVSPGCCLSSRPGQVVLRDRQAAHALARRREDGVAERRREGRHVRLADAGRRRRALH